jgi:hypothetical protein
MTAPKLLAMMGRQGIEGDDTLLRLAQARLGEAGLGAELYPNDPGELRHQLRFRPHGRPLTVHLPRDINLLSPEGRGRVRDFAAVAAGHAHGMIVHDHIRMGDRPDDTAAALREADRLLGSFRDPASPLLFVEYAAGLAPDRFAEMFERSADLPLVTACVDVSHVGIRVCQIEFGRRHPGIDVCSLKGSPDLPRHLDAVQEVVAEAPRVTLDLIRRLGRLGKPIHFHLHDGHPLSTLSRYGVSDHLGFLQTIRLPVERDGRRTVGGMYGPAGLRAIVAAAREHLPDERLSLMLEVHPQEGRSPLGPHAGLFSHWRDATNAERMNYWLDLLLSNAALLRDACGLPQ